MKGGNMKDIIFTDEEIELVAKAFTTYKQYLHNLTPEEKWFSEYELKETDRIANKLNFTQNFYTYETERR
jgi:hypothetical protein